MRGMGGVHRVLGADPSTIEGVQVSRGIVRRVARLARPYRFALGGFMVTLIAAAVFNLVPPLVFRQIIDQTIPAGDQSQLSFLGGVIVVTAFASAGLSFLERWWSARVGEGLIYDLRVALFDHVQRQPVAFFTRTQTGALISRLNNDVIGAQQAFTATLGSVVSNGVVLLTTVVAMAALEWRLTLLALALLPVFILPAKRVGRRLQALAREGMDLNSSMNNTMTERFNVAGALLVKLFGRYDDESDEFSRRAGRVRDIGVKSAIYGRTFFISLGLVAAIGVAAVYWVGGSLVISKAITMGTLVAMSAYVTRIYLPLTSLTNARVDIMTALVSFDRVFEVLDAPNQIEDRPGAIELVDPAGRIEFDDVRFTYPSATETMVASLEVGQPGQRSPLPVPPGSPTPEPAVTGSPLGPSKDQAGASARIASPEILHGLTAVIEPGQLVALVGPSGAGKTTLSSLVPRLYDVTSGSVRIDGNDVRDVTQDSLHSAVGVVSQDPHLFHESIGANLAYARPGATAGELEQACRAAQIHDFIESLPEGYDTVVGERGYRLSGGEKQRLAIARMLLKDPAIVILDEATSHLDSENEAAIQAALGVALRGRTALVIAHRLSTITNADQILVLDSGRLVEQGTHADLLVADGLYADLYRTLLRAETEAVA